MANIISKILENRNLPIDPNDILSFMTESDGNFLKTEGPTWDFKESWPHSYSDSYFHGVCRLACAFANSRGGLIIFGVSDKDRKASRNRIQPNLDRFMQSFKQLTYEDFEYDFRSYDSSVSGKFEILLVLPLAQNRQPLRFRNSDKFYPINTIWVRQGHEVVVAEPKHIPQLYCRIPYDDEGVDIKIEGSLPPSPATIRQFVGRMQTIDRIFEWIKLSDQPRNFLYGKGGSGKSTIAFQVAKVLRESGFGFLIENQDCLEKVIFLSAKERELNSDTQSENDFTLNDFRDERTLYESILIEGGTEIDSFDKMEMNEIKKEITKLLDKTCCFIVIDDIDTLTTKGLEAGFEFLFLALSRAKKRSKALYTLRNAPSQALSNSIDVPGLGIDGEYQEFVKIACEQFRVPTPSSECRDGVIAEISERRPLVIESIVALRRRVDSYERAVELFKSGGGNDVRRYVFRREWDAIKPSSRGRELLALLALYKSKIVYDDLVALMYDNASIVPDALAEVQEMFVQVDRSGDRTTYRLNELTRSFVLDTSKELDMYSGLRSRVQKFITNIYADNEDLNTLLRAVHRHIRVSREYADPAPTAEAWRMLMAAKANDSIREDPRFMSVCGYVALSLDPPNMSEARDYFQNSFAMRHGPDATYVRDWFIAEKALDSADKWTEKIYELVWQAKEYDESIRLEFLSRRAVTLYNIARNGFAIEPEDSLIRLIQAILLHGLGYKLSYQDGSRQSALFERNFTNSTFYLKTCLLRANRLDEMIDHLSDMIKNKSIKLDPLIEPIRELARDFVRYTLPQNYARAAGRLQHLGRILNSVDCWVDRTLIELVVGYCIASANELDQLRKRQAPRL
jgi:hypothetical protein